MLMFCYYVFTISKINSETYKNEQTYNSSTNPPRALAWQHVLGDRSDIAHKLEV